jgi:hypothetical protein
MSADAIGQIPTARWAQLDPATDRLYGELSEAEVPDACELSQARTRDAVLTLGDRMFPTVGEEENAFLGTQRPRLFAVEMRGRTLLEHEGVIRQDRASAVRADQWLFHR